MKSRGVYETPGGTILMAAHEQLEELVLDRATMEIKKNLGNKFAQIVYEGKWFTPLREAIQAFMDVTQEYVTGEVKFKLYKGNIIKAGETSPYSLYSESLASFTTGDLYDHHDADGFITLFGLPLKVRAMKMQEVAAAQAEGKPMKKAAKAAKEGAEIAKKAAKESVKKAKERAKASQEISKTARENAKHTGEEVLKAAKKGAKAAEKVVKRTVRKVKKAAEENKKK